MEKKNLLYEGKAKIMYETDSPDKLIVYYKDDATAGNGAKKGSIKDKGVINNKLSEFFFKFLAKNNIPTHYVETLNEREMVVQKLDMIALEVIVRNVAAGSLAKRIGFAEGTELKTPVLEYCYKNDELGDPILNNYHIAVLDIASKAELAEIEKISFAVNDLLRDFLRTKNIELIDFKLEFGRDKNNKIILADEISPDNCRFWDITTKEKLDKDRFRRDLGGVEDAYHEVLNRVTK